MAFVVNGEMFVFRCGGGDGAIDALVTGRVWYVSAKAGLKRVSAAVCEKCGHAGGS